jgi:hypothetical protein
MAQGISGFFIFNLRLYFKLIEQQEPADFFTRIDTINRSFYAIAIRPNRLQIRFLRGFESYQ